MALGICLGYFVSDPIDSPVCRIAITGHYHSLETFVRQIYDVLAGWFHRPFERHIHRVTGVFDCHCEFQIRRQSLERAFVEGQQAFQSILVALQGFIKATCGFNIQRHSVESVVRTGLVVLGHPVHEFQRRNRTRRLPISVAPHVRLGPSWVSVQRQHINSSSVGQINEIGGGVPVMHPRVVDRFRRFINADAQSIHTGAGCHRRETGAFLLVCNPQFIPHPDRLEQSKSCANSDWGCRQRFSRIVLRLRECAYLPAFQFPSCRAYRLGKPI